MRGYTDADFAGDRVNRKSTSGTLQFLSSCLVSWSSKKQNGVDLSTAKVVYVAAASYSSRLLLIRQQLRNFGIYDSCVPMYCDNTSATSNSKNPVYHSRVKHIEIRHYFLKENVEKGFINVFHIGTDYQIANIMTKPIKRDKHEKLRMELGMIRIN